MLWTSLVYGGLQDFIVCFYASARSLDSWVLHVSGNSSGRLLVTGREYGNCTQFCEDIPGAGLLAEVWHKQQLTFILQNLELGGRRKSDKNCLREGTWKWGLRHSDKQKKSGRRLLPFLGPEWQMSPPLPPLQDWTQMPISSLWGLVYGSLPQANSHLPLGQML